MVWYIGSWTCGIWHDHGRRPIAPSEQVLVFNRNKGSNRTVASDGTEINRVSVTH
jgi:hypothetical protein